VPPTSSALSTSTHFVTSSSTTTSSIHPMSKVTLRLRKNTCCKRMFYMSQRYVASVLYGCCKIRPGCLHMLQELYTYVANVYSQCFICFLQVCLFGRCIHIGCTRFV
jgi:hypothetical protein